MDVDRRLEQDGRFPDLAPTDPVPNSAANDAAQGRRASSGAHVRTKRKPTVRHRVIGTRSSCLPEATNWTLKVAEPPSTSLNARVFRAYLLKEELRALYRCGPRSAPEHLRSWLSWASRSNLGPFVKLGRTLRQYRDGVLAAIRLRLSNGRMEGLNNKIGVIKHRAYGFHSFAALAAMVFLCCTDLQLKLPI